MFAWCVGGKSSLDLNQGLLYLSPTKREQDPTAPVLRTCFMATIRFKLNGGATTPARTLNPGVNRVGRGEDNDIRIDHVSVSWHHCQLELSDEALVVRDSQSRNGTFINERQVVEASGLREGQVLRMGDVEAIVEQLPVRVAVPEILIEKQPASVKLDDGSESCTNHPTVRASWRCMSCGKIVCNTCVHDLHLRGKPSHKLCPLCSHHCEAIVWDDGKGGKKSIWGVIKGVFGAK